MNQLLALVNFGILTDFSRSSSFGIMVYSEINSANSSEVGALSNLLVCWINVLTKIAAPRSIKVEDTYILMWLRACLLSQ